ncbi:hypothetical protein ACOI1H_16400 [Loktanella sp. DJP18]|uniref:hypothetical protein n=1 Tax=Loktanella sp. DJP18 TaxID=3409788 RepID=UPI003BB4B7EC
MTSGLAYANSANRYAQFGSLSALCKSIRTLDYNRRAHLALGCKPEDVAFMDAPLAAAVTAVFHLLETHPELLTKHRQTILSSFHRPLIALLPPARPGELLLNETDWRLLLTGYAPEDLELMISKGLGASNCLKAIFKCLRDQVRPQKLAQVFAGIIGEQIGGVEQARKSGKIVWFDPKVKNILNPLFAPYMSAQVKAYPHDVLNVVCVAKLEGHLRTLLCFYMAGAPYEYFFLNDTPAGPVRAFVNKLKSNHGRMEIHAFAGSLASAMQLSSASITEFLS